MTYTRSKRIRLKLFLDQALKSSKFDFKKHLQKNGLFQFIYNPFYLTHLVKIFKENRNHLPSSRIEAIRYFIKESFDAQAERIVAGVALKRNQVQYQHALEKLAFALQMLGKNSLSDLEVQELFRNQDERNLLKQGSILNFSRELWSFENAIFQEHLAALFLQNLSYAEIEDIVCVGASFKKIKTKWIQTVVTLLTLLEQNNKVYRKLVRLLEMDNIELIRLCESSFMTTDFKNNTIHKIIDRYEMIDANPSIASEINLARFIGNSHHAINYLIQKISPIKKEKFKITLWRILEHIELPPHCFDTVFNLAQCELNYTNNGFYGLW